MKIFITGIGVVSAVGLTAEENLRSLEAKTTGIRKSTEHGLMLGEVKLSDEQLVHQLNLPPEDYSRTTLLSLLAARQAWDKNRLLDDIRTGMISSTSVGGLDRTEKYYFDSLNNNSSLAYQRMTHDNGRTTEKVAAVLGISGYIGTISTACSSGANAIMQGAGLIEANKLDRVIVGGSDPLAIFDIKGFSSLNIYDPELCKPFDDNRMGLNLGEGAGFLVMENEKSLSTTGNKVLCLLTGWGNMSDAFHQTASSPEGRGATRAMITAIARAKLNAGDISYVNAHGTGTGNNDLSESAALKAVFGKKLPPFSSTKGFTGHTLAAAGAIEAVYCVQAIMAQAFLPNLNFLTPMKETGLIPEKNYKTGVKVNHVLSNSFGFGGNCSSLIFSKAL